MDLPLKVNKIGLDPIFAHLSKPTWLSWRFRSGTRILFAPQSKFFLELLFLLCEVFDLGFVDGEAKQADRLLELVKLVRLVIR